MLLKKLTKGNQSFSSYLIVIHFFVSALVNYLLILKIQLMRNMNTFFKNLCLMFAIGQLLIAHKNFGSFLRFKHCTVLMGLIIYNFKNLIKPSKNETQNLQSSLCLWNQTQCYLVEEKSLVICLLSVGNSFPVVAFLLESWSFTIGCKHWQFFWRCQAPLVNFWENAGQVQKFK